MPDDDLVVEIDETADANLASAVDPAAPKDKTPKEPDHKPDPIAELKAQHEESLARERQRAGAAEQRAASEAQARNAAEQERDAVRSEAADTQLTALERALAAADTASQAAQSEYTAALEAGDWKKAGEAQVKLADARAEAHSLKRDKADFELRKAQKPEPTQQRQTQQQTTYSDPVEQFISMAGVDQQGQPVQRTSAAQNWMRNHVDVVRDAVNDRRKMMKLGAADQLAVAEGLDRDTPEYFAHVEKTLGIAKPAATNGAGNGAAKPNGAQRRQSAPVAPVQQSAGETQGGGDVVRLTKGEAAAATDGTHVWNYDDPSPQKKFKKGDPIGVQEFARRKLAMGKQGLYDKTYYEN